MEEAIRNEKLDFSKISEAEPAKYKRNASGISPKDIRKCRAEFKKRTSVQRQEKRFAFTAPNYDEEYDRAMTKLDELAR